MNLSTRLIDASKSRHPIATAVIEKRPVIVNDLSSSKSYEPRKLADKLKLKTLFSIPLLLPNNEVLGALNVYFSANKEFDATTQTVTAFMAYLLGRNTLEVQLQERSRLLENLTQVRKLDVSVNPNQFWETVSEKVAKMYWSGNCYLLCRRWTEQGRHANWYARQRDTRQRSRQEYIVVM